jgi:hypothetical protein
MDPFAFLNDRLEELPGVGSSVLERLKYLDIGGGAFLPDPFSADLGSLFASKSAVPDVGAPQGFVTPNADAKYYAGEKYGYQSPESYKKVHGGYPRSYREIQKAQLDEAAKQQAQEEQTKEQKELEALILGAQKDGKFYAGKDYGYQSAPSYKAVRGAFPAGYTEPGKKGPTELNAPASKGSDSTNIAGQTQKPPIISPDLERIQDKNIAALLEREALNFARQQQIASQYDRSAQEKSILNTQRQVELENIKAWRDKSIAEMEMRTRSAALTASLTTALQQPNVNFMNAISEAFNAGAAPFSARVRTRA